MNVWINLGILFLSVSCFADSMKPAVLDLECTESGEKNRTVQVQSNEQGTVIVLGNKIHQRDEQLIAGTEGGPAYAQAVDNSEYNITIHGQDFTTAFNNSSEFENGVTTVQVELFNDGGDSYVALCRGLISFKQTIEIYSQYLIRRLL